MDVLGRSEHICVILIRKLINYDTDETVCRFVNKMKV